MVGARVAVDHRLNPDLQPGRAGRRPVSSATRSSSVSPRRRTWVAQAGWSTVTTRAFGVDPDRLHVLGHGRPDDLRPTGEQAAEAARSPRMPSRFDTASSEAVERPGSGVPAVGARGPSRPGLRGRSEAARRRPHGVDLGRDHLGRGRQGRGQQGLARREPGQQGPRPERVELGEHVVEQEHRCGAQALGGQLVGGQLQGQGQGTLLPLGGVGPARQARRGSGPARRGGDRRSTPPARCPWSADLGQGVEQRPVHERR